MNTKITVGTVYPLYNIQKTFFYCPKIVFKFSKNDFFFTLANRFDFHFFVLPFCFSFFIVTLPILNCLSVCPSVCFHFFYIFLSIETFSKMIMLTASSPFLYSFLQSFLSGSPSVCLSASVFLCLSVCVSVTLSLFVLFSMHENFDVNIKYLKALTLVELPGRTLY